MRAHARRLDTLLLVGGVLLSLFCALPCVGQPGGWDEDTPIQADFNAGRHTEPLPFDVRFLLYTPPPTGWMASDVEEVWLMSGPQAAKACAHAIEPHYDSNHPKALCSAPPQKDTFCTLTHGTRTWPKESGGAPLDQIEITVPRLRVKNDHCFLLQLPLNETQQLELVDVVRTVLWTETQDIASITPERETAICARLNMAVTAKAKTLGLSDHGRSAGGAKINCADVITAWKATAVARVSMANLVSQIQISAQEIAQVLAVHKPQGEDPLASLRFLDSPRKVLAYVLGLDPRASKLPATAGEAVPGTAEEISEMKAAVELRIQALVPGARDCERPDSSEDHANSIETIADALAGVCIDLSGLEEQLHESIQTDQAALETYKDFIHLFGLNATTSAGWEGRLYWYMSADQGLGYGWDVKESFGYTGVNIYFRPVNKKAPLDGFTFGEQLGRRFALMVGLPDAALSDDPAWDGILLDRPLLIGGGVRLTDHARLTVGALVVDENDPDPLVDETEGWKLTPFASLSLDIDLVGRFKQWFGSGSGTR